MTEASAIAGPRMSRPRDCLATGVCAGLAAHLGWPPVVVRLAFAVTALLGGAGVLLYLWLWALTPWEPGEARPSRRAPVAWLLVAASALVLGFAWMLGAQALGTGNATVQWWFGAVLAGVALAVGAGAWASFIDRPEPERGPRHELTIRLVATGLLAVTALALVLGDAASRHTVASFTAALAAIVGIALVYAPTLVTAWRDLTEERTKRIREEQRSEIAAHLHDSVLQTLALIQNRAGATSEVARIARAQERELRDWLFDGEAPADRDLGTELRAFAADLEIEYAVTIDVVAVGTSSERASGEVAAAAREAMLNAARHAGGEVSVYLEASPELVEVFVRDRGPGFDPAEVPGDRLGVRQSIIGRMRRAGGSAEVRRGVGGVGTEVRLRFPAERAATVERATGDMNRG
ncbi:signal transduction histidine kinase [Agromyces terreus]|uniref:Signal transduction histidine kinase n=1 Tax=Agromyces terreus TaxID=424795 RepID=A0A9X2KB28_9MICO|nr:ATP-binding protein [Agromyces terreus]MCP2369911.1 signal transduction histidine kinase [Agromyces terreus]